MHLIQRLASHIQQCLMTELRMKALWDSLFLILR
ncbi:hypothetical protein SMTE4_11460 [Serratia marcescens]|nr:hypothetical protein SMTE4_11460 [Serratia marcescens]